MADRLYENIDAPNPIPFKETFRWRERARSIAISNSRVVANEEPDSDSVFSLSTARRRDGGRSNSKNCDPDHISRGPAGSEYACVKRDRGVSGPHVPGTGSPNLPARADLIRPRLTKRALHRTIRSSTEPKCACTREDRSAGRSVPKLSPSCNTSDILAR